MGIVLVFAISYRTGLTSPSTGYVDADATAYRVIVSQSYEWNVYYGYASASVYATEISEGDPNSGTFSMGVTCGSISLPIERFDFYNGTGFSTSVSGDFTSSVHCEADATISADGGYDYDSDEDGQCYTCDPDSF